MPVGYMVTLIAPLTIIALSIPLILQKIPRNRLYGFRTAYTLSSDAVWYRANKIAGVAVLLGGIAWLLAGQILPRIIDSRAALQWVGPIGAAALLAACVVSAWLIYSANGSR